MELICCQVQEEGFEYCQVSPPVKVAAMVLVAVSRMRRVEEASSMR